MILYDFRLISVCSTL